MKHFEKRVHSKYYHSMPSHDILPLENCLLRLEKCLHCSRVFACGLGGSTLHTPSSLLHRIECNTFVQCERIPIDVGQKLLGTMVIASCPDFQRVWTVQLGDKVLDSLVSRQLNELWQVRHCIALQEELLERSVAACSNARIT